MRSNTNRRSSSTGRGGRGGGSRSGKGWLYAAMGVVIVLIVALIVWPKSSNDIDLSRMEEFVQVQIEVKTNMPDDWDAYIDFSNGMQWAYKDAVIKDNLVGIVQKLTKYSEFYSLANNVISPMGKQDSKTIYNRIIDDASYRNTSAPMDSMLGRIVERGCPAFVMSDFEEYSGGKIQLVCWAKKYFIDWLNMGNDITFYVMDYMENGKPKHLYFAVFDGKPHALLKDIDDALVGKVCNYTRFTLSNDNFPMARGYYKDIIGGNYHEINANGTPGKDNVTLVDERGTSASYRVLEGYYAEVYPLQAGTWANVIANAKALSAPGVPDNLRFSHLISQRYMDLTQNTGYDIEELGLIVTDVTGQFVAMVANTVPPSPVVVKDMFKLANPVVENPSEHEIQIDLDPKFDGIFPHQGQGERALYRLDIVVAKATPRYDLVENLFSWPGNNSLAESVRNALQACNPDDNLSHAPQGKRLFTFYLQMK